MDQKSEKWIFIRGLIRSQYHWFEFPNQFKTLFPESDIRTPELQGNGIYSNKNFYNHIDDCILDLEKQCQLEDNYKVNLLGISLGGMIAANWAQKKPRNIQKLVLINSSFSNSPFYHRLKIENYPKIIQLLFKKNPFHIEKFIIDQTMNSTDKLKYLHACVEFQKQNPVTFINFYRQLKFAQNLSAEEKPIEQVLILTCENDRLVNYKCSQKIAMQWNCAHEVHPWAGHDLPADDGLWIMNMLQKNFN